MLEWMWIMSMEANKANRRKRGKVLKINIIKISKAI
jgi:hypothetical protein